MSENQTEVLILPTHVLAVQAECYHYLFEAALRLHQLGIDPADPKHGPIRARGSVQAVAQNDAGPDGSGKVFQVSCSAVQCIISFKTCQTIAIAF